MLATASAPHRLWVVLRLVGGGGGDESGGTPRLNERAIALAASLIHAAGNAEVAVGLAIPGLSSDGDRERGSAGTARIRPQGPRPPRRPLTARAGACLSAPRFKAPEETHR